MEVKINGNPIPENSLQSVEGNLGGQVKVKGEAVSFEDRNIVSKAFEGLKDNDVVEFFAIDSKGFKHNRAGKILALVNSEEGVSDNVMRIRFSFDVQPMP